MKLSKLIEQAEKLLKEHGDLEVFTDATYEVTGFSQEESEGEFPKDWGMPAGYKYIRVNDFS